MRDAALICWLVCLLAFLIALAFKAYEDFGWKGMFGVILGILFTICSLYLLATFP